MALQRLLWIIWILDVFTDFVGQSFSGRAPGRAASYGWLKL